MIDLTPGRKSISARYGVELPRQALARILTERCGPEAAAAILQELARAENRYQHAVKVEQARRRCARFTPEQLAQIRQHPISRAEKALARSADLLDRAADYIEGTWKP